MREPLEPYTPSILIQIDSGLHPPRLRLKVTRPEVQEKYVALSYCWGDVDSPRTILTNLDIWTQDLPFSLLPQTIQDAVLVTKELGLNYLWVDRFCIVQDDEVAKAQEISRMAQIYGAAYVTILASAARKSSDGFLRLRTPDPPSRTFSLPYRGRDTEESAKTGSIILSLSHPDQSDDEPINSRGWTL